MIYLHHFINKHTIANILQIKVHLLIQCDDSAKDWSLDWISFKVPGIQFPGATKQGFRILIDSILYGEMSTKFIFNNRNSFLNLKSLSRYLFAIDDCDKDGGPGRSRLYVVLTIILCSTNFFILYDMKMKFKVPH